MNKKFRLSLLQIHGSVGSIPDLTAGTKFGVENNRQRWSSPITTGFDLDPSMIRTSYCRFKTRPGSDSSKITNGSNFNTVVIALGSLPSQCMEASYHIIAIVLSNLFTYSYHIWIALIKLIIERTGSQEYNIQCSQAPSYMFSHLFSLWFFDRVRCSLEKFVKRI